MGIYFNTGNELFKRCLNSEIYVDKTRLIHFTNEKIDTKNNLICVSRPRRFGKSMALEMLAAYYSKGCDSREIFKGLKANRYDDTKSEAVNRKQAEKFEKNMNAYDVIYIDMQEIYLASQEHSRDEVLGFRQKIRKMSAADIKELQHPRLADMQKMITEDICKDDELRKFIPENPVSLGDTMLKIYENTGRKFIMLVDEWDFIFRNYPDDVILQDKYIDWLRGMFKTTARLPMFALVYMTGILPIKRYETQSAMNNFKEYTFLNPHKLAEFSGFTEDEVAELCEEYNIDFDEMSNWYNGYYFKKSGRIYNPNSVVCAVSNEDFGSYWTETGTYESVKRCIDMNFDGLKDKVISLLGNERIKVDTGSFNNTMTCFENADDALTLLIHLGYLGYDESSDEVYIPNKEIRNEFVRAIRGSKWTKTFEAVSESEKLLEATLECDETAVAECIEKVHTDNTSIIAYNDEKSLSCVIQLAYFKARDEYMMIREMPSGKGFADIVFVPRRSCTKPAMVIELKWNKTAETAIDQIKNRQYGENLKEYFGEILLVGINYDKKSDDKRHECVIEKIVRDKVK